MSKMLVVSLNPKMNQKIYRILPPSMVHRIDKISNQSMATTMHSKTNHNIYQSMNQTLGLRF